jgi:hypothetical protein
MHATGCCTASSRSSGRTRPGTLPDCRQHQQASRTLLAQSCRQIPPCKPQVAAQPMEAPGLAQCQTAGGIQRKQDVVSAELLRKRIMHATGCCTASSSSSRCTRPGALPDCRQHKRHARRQCRAAVKEDHATGCCIARLQAA